VRLFRRRKDIGRRTEEGDDGDASMMDTERGAEEREVGEMMVAVGGEGEGSAAVKIGAEGGKGRISLGSVAVGVAAHSRLVSSPLTRCFPPLIPYQPRISCCLLLYTHRRAPITALVLSKSQSHLISGTAHGHIHIHSLPSHQHLRTITSHIGVPITHLSTLVRPPDLVGSVSLRDAANAATMSVGGIVGAGAWPVKEVKQFERMKVVKRDAARQMGDVGVMLRPLVGFSELDELDTLEDDQDDELAFAAYGNGTTTTTTSASLAPGAVAEKLSAVQAELEAVKAQLQRATEINQEMWNGVVERTFEQVAAAGGKGGNETEGDVQMAD
jgi:hypothetical protein